MTTPILTEAIGIPDGIETEFYTSEAFLSGTVRCYLNGQLIRAEDDDGFEELGNVRVRHKIAPLTNDVIHYYFQKLDSLTEDEQEPPEIYESIELLPDLYAALHLVPEVVSAIDETETYDPPDILGNIHLVPDTDRVIHLVPEIIYCGEE